MNKKIWLFVLILLAGIQLNGQDNSAFVFAKVPGNVIIHQPSSTGLYVGAPSIVSMGNGHYIVSLNFTSIALSDAGKVHQTAVFRSTDHGVSWEFLTMIENQRWSTIFYFRGALYLLGVDKAFGNVVIRRSLDGGKTWSEPGVEKNGLLAEGRYHCAPTPVIISQRRIWKAMEYAPVDRQFQAFMISAPVESDLMNACNWTLSNKIPFSKSWYHGKLHSWLEGNAVIVGEKVVDVLRCEFISGVHSIAAVMDVSNDGRKVTFNPDNGFIHFPGATKKFTIRYDTVTHKYWSLVNWIQPGDQKYLKDIPANRIRNTLALVSSTNLRDWIIERIVLYHPDIKKHGFQYVDWLFEGQDIIAVSRTAYDDKTGGAYNYHDANYILFHRIVNFRDLCTR